MATAQRIYLIPGFFGFVNLGEIVYFAHVRDALMARFAERGVPASVVPVPARPTAAISVRVKELYAFIAEHAAGDDAPIHLIGHSSGGLDARGLVSNGAFGSATGFEAVAKRVRSVVTLSTPHGGTPLAAFFTGMAGPQLLRVLSVFTAAVLRGGRLPLSVLFRIGGAMTRADDFLGWRKGVLDAVFAQLLSDFSPERQRELTRFFADVSADQGLIPQLTPEAMTHFNAATPDRPEVRYGSVVTRAPAPQLRTRLRAGLDPYAHFTQTFYMFLYQRACGLTETGGPALTAQQDAALRWGYLDLPGLNDNDGIVPTRSQPHGEVLAAVEADHLDAIGHFDGPHLEPPHVDWLSSGAGFHREQFDLVWNQVTRFLLQEL